jgi:hypothetical protein
VTDAPRLEPAAEEEMPLQRGIHFTRYLLPHGRRRAERIERSEEIEALAQQFIAAGGWYECEILTTGHISLTACLNVDDEPQDIVCKVCANGPQVPAKVDELVRASVTQAAALSKATAESGRE